MLNSFDRVSVQISIIKLKFFREELEEGAKEEVRELNHIIYSIDQQPSSVSPVASVPPAGGSLVTFLMWPDCIRRIGIAGLLLRQAQQPETAVVETPVVETAVVETAVVEPVETPAHSLLQFVFIEQK